MGLDNIYHMTSQRDHMLQVDLEAFDGDFVSVVFDSFRIGSETDNYRLHVSDWCPLLTSHNVVMTVGKPG